MSRADDIRREEEAVAAVRSAFEALAPHLPYVWHWGDGEGGYLLEVLRSVAEAKGLIPDAAPVDPGYRREPIGRDLARQVYERDAYRCVTCGSWKELQLDHRFPVAAGGPSTFDNLQVMCGPCNRTKGAAVS